MKQLLLTIDVECLDGIGVKGQTAEITMVPFCGKAHSDFFNGSIIGTGVDTQRLDKHNGEFTLSARYMLEGTDKDGKLCRIFIDNSRQDEDGFHPTIVTDSKCLAGWETAALTASVTPSEAGVTVRIYCTA